MLSSATKKQTTLPPTVFVGGVVVCFLLFVVLSGTSVTQTLSTVVMLGVGVVSLHKLLSLTPPATPASVNAQKRRAANKPLNPPVVVEPATVSFPKESASECCGGPGEGGECCGGTSKVSEEKSAKGESAGGCGDACCGGVNVNAVDEKSCCGHADCGDANVGEEEVEPALDETLMGFAFTSEFEEAPKKEKPAVSVVNGNSSSVPRYSGSDSTSRKRVKGRKRMTQLELIHNAVDIGGNNNLLILYATQSGTAELYAKELKDVLAPLADTLFNVIRVEDASTYDVDTLPLEDFVVIIVPTYSGGAPVASFGAMYEWLASEALQPRSGNLLRGVKFGVFGLGNSEYGRDVYNTTGRGVDRLLFKLGGLRFCKLGEGDESADSGGSFKKWCTIMVERMTKVIEKRQKDEAIAAYVSSDSEQEEEDATPFGDIEDSANNPELRTTQSDGTQSIREMLSETQKRILSKQGYRVVGSHSGVKMCRWTKSMLRGRGGCYKHTFYGIGSHQCMEMTPSMACANKCVFCWRHHKNPVGTRWRWQMDDPHMIFKGVVENHYNMIKQLRGLQGLKMERYNEATKIRHCALSLVGEPVMYPEISKFLGDLHDADISTFLVTNAQFPDELAQLTTVTQLYVSIDASTPDALKAVDRPLFKNFWDRMMGCLDVIAKKPERTVFRLTLVKEYNMSDIDGYVQMINRGKPDFIELKGVTFCGGGKRAELKMTNVPWHDEVLNFVKSLVALCPEYEIASEHAHSCCVLIAHKKFKIDGKWFTHIDFDKYLVLLRSGKPFTALDYVAPTPYWAVLGAEERGFDPGETRVRDKGAFSKTQRKLRGESGEVHDQKGSDAIALPGPNKTPAGENTALRPSNSISGGGVAETAEEEEGVNSEEVVNGGESSSAENLAIDW